MNVSTEIPVEEYIQTATNIIQQLYVKYADNKYMLNRAHTYICEQLPITLENIHVKNEKVHFNINI
jgi:hypothetical protein